ncbi:endo alpha-1,4 polygalactosaminidase [Sulfurimonas sp.]|uniref:endo alpha-1,4 polygalactosaminidase n=1 Tax=Sulfurimonas sp. TaxID=2022749 RepID=UPI002616E28D|nr:endo alpha-1,4 polygalactosaminidase [Sulfurimonas sp.]
MKLLCCNKLLLLVLLIYTSAFASLSDKSSVIYYGKNISYPMVGVHDYIIVQPSNTNTHTHGFKLYKDKMYAYVSIGEIDQEIDEYQDLNKSLIIGENKAWKGKLLDLSNPEYKRFLFENIIEPQRKRGFKNFFFDTLDSYQLIAKTQKQRSKNEAALVDIIHSFHQKYPDAKLIINRGFEIIDKVHDDVNAVLFESYYHGIGGKNLSYQEVSDTDRQWLDSQIKKVQSYNLNVICVDYLPLESMPTQAKALVKRLQAKGFIPYVATKDLNTYGYSSKTPIKREILTLIDESVHDRVYLTAHQMGALALEYEGYIQKLYNVDKKPLPSMHQMQQYGGVIVWLGKDYKKPQALINWILNLQKYNIKVVFASSFFLPYNTETLSPLYISFEKQNNITTQKHIAIDKMIGYEIDVPKINDNFSLHITKGETLCTLINANNQEATLAAIMPWGGFSIGNAFIYEFGEDNLWVTNPFEFFKKALRLEKIPVADPSTENGKRILFSHVDGDGIMSRAEWNPKLFSGDTIYKDILQKYKLPISVSIIGAEVDNNGLYPELAPQLQKIVKKIYKLPNVEPATHTFTHPFFWNKIKDGNLDEKYRLKPKGYHFSLYNELKGMIDEINVKYLPKDKTPKAQTVFWSGDCIPTEKVLDFSYKHNILNINGGNTYISNLHPWLSNVAPLGLERGEYYQIYAGTQNENVFTNEWLGPFWGFKKVVQTFKLTESPRRLKPIDIYYHLYSGSKKASLKALDYVYDWALKQDVMPIFTSEYIPKVMDYYTVSLAEENNAFLITGMKDLKTLRLEKMQSEPSLKSSKNIIGFKNVTGHNYIHLGTDYQARLSLAGGKEKKRAYLRSANAKITASEISKDSLRLKLEGHIALKLEVYLTKECQYTLNPPADKISYKNNILNAVYKTKTGATLNVVCKP